MKIVIDTNIFLHGEVNHEDFNMNCLMFLSNFMQTKSLEWTLDDNNEIMQEYQDNHLGNDKVFQAFLHILFTENRVVYRSAKIDNKHKNQLMRLGFHELEDHVFVGTAMHADKIIVTDDSDYGINDEPEKCQVYEYMTNEMKLNVWNSNKAVEKATTKK